MNATVRSTTLELTINPEYVVEWGAWEGLRELLQNAVDAHDLGYPMTVTHRINSAGVGVLRITNDGVTMQRDTLLLGTTSKRDDERTRGQFGEGFKLAWLALLRKGARIKVKSGDEIWIPQLAHSDRFGGKLIRVRCKPAQFEHKVTVYIEGIDRDTWEAVQDKLLFLRPAKGRIDVGRSGILMDLEHAGLLYARGIFVGKLPGKYRWGYDLHEVKLDRDRRLADPWDLKWQIRHVLEEAVERDVLRPDQVYAIVRDASWAESEAIGSQYTALASVLADQFRAEHGDDAVPVKDFNDSADAAQHGLKGIVVSHCLCEALSESLPTLAKAKEERVRDVKHRYSVHELAEDELANIMWAQRLAGKWLEGGSLIIVDFYGNTIVGAQCGDETQVCRSQLTNRRALIATIVHELAHREGGADGSAEHRENIERIFADILCTEIE